MTAREAQAEAWGIVSRLTALLNEGGDVLPVEVRQAVDHALGDLIPVLREWDKAEEEGR